VAMHGASIALILTLPDAGWVSRLDADTPDIADTRHPAAPDGDQPTSFAASLQTLGSGLSATRRQPHRRRRGRCSTPRPGQLDPGHRTPRRHRRRRGRPWARLPWALLGIGITYGTIETTWVITDARFQAAAPRATRATVTSVRGLGDGLVAGLAFLLIALLASGDDPSPGLHWVIGLLALVSLLIWKWVPSLKMTKGRPR